MGQGSGVVSLHLSPAWQLNTDYWAEVEVTKEAHIVPVLTPTSHNDVHDTAWYKQHLVCVRLSPVADVAPIDPVVAHP